MAIVPSRAAALLASLLAGSPAIVAVSASAQIKSALPPSTKAPVIRPLWQDCAGAGAPHHLEAIAKATELLAGRWTATERGHFAAYTMAGEQRNPFDLSPRTPDGGPRDGLVQARPPACTWRAGDAPGTVLVRFASPYYRFYETGPGWSAPLRDGLMLEALVEHAGEAWRALDVGAERSILLPEQKPRRADATALPADARWAAPMTGCGRLAKWNGEACVARKR